MTAKSTMYTSPNELYRFLGTGYSPILENPNDDAYESRVGRLHLGDIVVILETSEVYRKYSTGTYTYAATRVLKTVTGECGWVSYYPTAFERISP
jgi:hypothetical protein